MTQPATNPDPDKPIENFSQCHVGILRHLDAFAGLPALLDPATQARQIAKDMLGFFRDVVYDHHAEEERELFPAVLASAQAGDEKAYVQNIVDRLTAEHRQIERTWQSLEPELKHVAKGQDSSLGPIAVSSLVATYRAHAQYEEQVFLPLSQTILSRNSNHMAALGLSLHLRHAVPEVLSRFAARI
jgi:hemerythrin-like domain-containing protein